MSELVLKRVMNLTPKEISIGREVVVIANSFSETELPEFIEFEYGRDNFTIELPSNVRPAKFETVRVEFNSIYEEYKKSTFTYLENLKIQLHKVMIEGETLFYISNNYEWYKEIGDS